METKPTPGPWSVHFEDRWPWGINIEPNVLNMARIAYSTRQKSLADVRDAVGFDHDEKVNVVRAVAEQEANAHLVAASWSFYRAAKLRAEWFRLLDFPCPSPDLSMDAIRDAEMAWQAMEAQAMAIAEGRLLPATQDGEGR